MEAERAELQKKFTAAEGTIKEITQRSSMLEKQASQKDEQQRYEVFVPVVLDYSVLLKENNELKSKVGQMEERLKIATYVVNNLNVA